MSAGTVGWDDDVVTSWPGLAPLGGHRVADACVVGLGASGLAAVEAFWSPAGSRWSASTRAGSRPVQPVVTGDSCSAVPRPYLHDAIARWGTEPAVALYRATLDELQPPGRPARAGRGPARRLDPARRAAGSAG